MLSHAAVTSRSGLPNTPAGMVACSNLDLLAQPAGVQGQGDAGALSRAALVHVLGSGGLET